MTTPIGDFTSFAATLPRADALPRRPAPIRDEGVATPSLPGGGATPVDGAGRPEGPDFGGRVRELLSDANANQLEGEAVAEAYANGERNDLHGTMIALEQADISLRLVSNMRTRLVEAYREVMRMGG